MPLHSPLPALLAGRGISRRLAAAALAVLVCPLAARAGDARPADARPADARPADARPADARPDEATTAATTTATTADASAPAPAKTGVVHGGTVTVRAAPASHPKAPTRGSTRVDLSNPTGLDLDLAGPLARAPEVALHRTGGPGSLLSVSLWGSASDQVVVLLGGLPLTPPGGGSVDLSGIPPSLLSAISVTPGTQGAAYGAGALGGVLHLEPIGRGATDGLRLELGGGSFGTGTGAITARGRAGGTRLAGGLALSGSRGDFPYERDLTPNLAGDPWTPSVRANDASLMGAGLLAARVPTAGGPVDLTAFSSRTGRQVPGLSGFPTPGATDTSWRTLAGLVWRGRAHGAHALSPTVRVYTGADGFDYRSGPTPTAATGASATGERSVLGASGGLRWLSGSVVPRVGLGATFEHYAGTGADVVRASADATGAADAFLAGGRLDVHAALRLSGYTGLGLAIAPSAGVRFVAGHGVSLDANLARAVRMPTLESLYADTALVRANPDLKAESAITGDLAASIAGRLGHLRLVGFVSGYQDLIVYDLYPPLKLRPANVASARVAGLEIEGRLHAWRWLDLELAYALTSAVDTSGRPNEDGRPLPYRPPHRGLVRMELHLGRVRAYAELEGQSATPRNRAATKILPARLVANAGVRVRLGLGVSLSAEATNLLDDRRLEDVYGEPLPGRTVLVSARLDLPLQGDKR